MTVFIFQFNTGWPVKTKTTPMEYSGCSHLDTVPRVPNTIDPIEFFERFVKTRTPVVVEGLLTDEKWQGWKWLNSDYLRSVAGEEVVKVERRSKVSDNRFGKGCEEKMKFGDFLTHLDSGDQSLYMTTQDLTYSAEGLPSLISPPVTSLVKDFVWTPRILGNLVLQNANLWMGSTRDESTSGLHHDHHDNLYVLLRGEKRFVLLSPAEAPNVYTVGDIVRVHPNGRINYTGQLTCADGSDPLAIAAAAASKAVIEAAVCLEEVG